MVYGRYIYTYYGYKEKNITGGHHLASTLVDA
jgi:hypothetical protein